WGLLWGVLVFHELQGGSRTVYAQVTGGSLLMMLGALAIALSSANESEHSSWKVAAQREGLRYEVDDEYVRAGLDGVEFEKQARGAGRSLLDWLLILGTTGMFVALGLLAKVPGMNISLGWATGLVVAMLGLLATCGFALWRTTGFR
ncbi:MAG TPA: hypothetical protein VMB66_14225, partial [Candidatus Acidoferrales bacterium]|nr:hypothetical protein [Candidatus Acidoferrales bacterium]